LDRVRQPSAGLQDSPATSLRRGNGDQGYTFGNFRLEADGTLYRGDEIVHLPPKELAALRFLLAHAGQIVTALQLKQELWGEVHVTADSVPKCLSSLRARLEPDEYIQTIYKRGYRLSAEVRLLGADLAPALPRLAMMPFVSGFDVPEHLGLAIAEEAAARLANMRDPAAIVLARDSVFTLASRGLTAQQLGASLKAGLVITGTVSAVPAHFRLRAEMIRVEDGAQIWVEDILVPKARVAGLESELVRRLLFRLGAEGVPISAVVGQEGAGQSREAYETFQRARYEWQTLQRHRMQDGLQHLTHASELDPSLISAKADLVHLCVTQSFYGFMAPSVAAELVHRTVESVPGFPHQAESMLPALGWISFHWDHNLPAALWAFSLSAHLPHDPWTTRMRAMFDISRGRYAQAISLLRAALQEDPYSPWLHNRLAWAFHLSGQAEASLEQVRQGIELFPDHEGTSLYGAVILAFNGEAEQATLLSQRLARRLPYFDLATAVHAYTLACEGRKDEAHSILERLQWLSRERFVIRSFNPAVYVALGDYDAALAEMQVAAESRCPWFFQMHADPRLKPLRKLPEFEQMGHTLARMEASAKNELEDGG
jgi:DNA-binding winged helix-turn-helix (wHTH) protein/tetratricopeptide (TPR) repeat protein